MSKGKKIAIFGGTFDPVHIGHCMVASSVIREGVADEVWMMVSPQNPLKIDKKLTSESERLAMVSEACRGVEGMVASDFEFGLPRPTYTAATLRALKERWPENEYRLLTGSDNWLLFDRWREPDKILSEFGLIIYPRPDAQIPEGFRPLERMPEGWEERVEILCDIPEALISSTYIREAVSRGESIRFLVPEGVERYILDRGLYLGIKLD